ncbi:MAG: glutaminyl-peptide cyclotransferase [Bacteroidales bacterium]|nr:glutaminyl-peptide cyclotransferase [Bacteroidales bacterium]
MRHLYIYVLFLIAACAVQCGENVSDNSTKHSGNGNAQQTTAPKSHFRLEVVAQNPDAYGVCGDVYDLKVLADTAIVPDSVRFLVDGVQVAAYSADTQYVLDTKKLRVGGVRLSAEAVYGGKTEYLSASIKLKSDIEPRRLTYKVVKRFPHDRAAYTQGLVFDNGVMYESTGLNRKSSLRKVGFEKGDILQSIALGDEYFGEGLAIDGDRLIQITWKNHKGFVYDKNSFSKLHEFDISTEGWGLVLHNDTLILTDGSENLYFVDKNSFGTFKIMQVYDSNGPVKMLNELEIVDNLLFANIYQSDLVAVIDIPTGKVLSYIDFAGLLPSSMYADDTDVLNGIAYDSKNKRLYVTGKNWPQLFQVEIPNF